MFAIDRISGRAVALAALLATLAMTACDRGRGEASTADDSLTTASVEDGGGACHYVVYSDLTCPDDPPGLGGFDPKDECVETLDADGCDDRVSDKSFVDCEGGCCLKSNAYDALFVPGSSCSDPRPSGGNEDGDEDDDSDDSGDSTSSGDADSGDDATTFG